MQKKLFLRFYLPLLGICCLSQWIWGCNTETQPQQAQVTTSEPTVGQDSLALEMDTAELAVRSIARMTDAPKVDFPQEFPAVYRLLESDDNVLEVVAAYAVKLITGKGIENEADLLSLMDLRDEKIAPLLQSKVENLGEQVQQTQLELLIPEFERLAIRPIMAEGNFLGLGPGPWPLSQYRLSADAPVAMYAHFCDEGTRSKSGEYPYLDLTPYGRMVFYGERLQNTPTARVYFDRIEQDFRQALRVVTDIHEVADETSSNLLVGGVHVDPYPYMCDTSGLGNLIARFPNSPYSRVIEAILDRPSSISPEPANIYLLVVEWLTEGTEAQQVWFERLSKGQDSPHLLEVERGNGKVQLALTYRFFESEEMADKILTEYEAQGKAAELIFVSVEGDKLYQIGM